MSLKCKAIPVQPWTGPEGPVGWGFQISRQSAHEGGKVVSSMHRPSLPPRKYSWYSFLLEAESTPGPQCGQKDYVNEKLQWHHRESSTPSASTNCATAYPQFIMAQIRTTSRIRLNPAISTSSHPNCLIFIFTASDNLPSISLRFSEQDITCNSCICDVFPSHLTLSQFEPLIPEVLIIIYRVFHDFRA